MRGQLPGQKGGGEGRLEQKEGGQRWLLVSTRTLGAGHAGPGGSVRHLSEFYSE